MKFVTVLIMCLPFTPLPNSPNYPRSFNVITLLLKESNTDKICFLNGQMIINYWDSQCCLCLSWALLLQHQNELHIVSLHKVSLLLLFLWWLNNALSIIVTCPDHLPVIVTLFSGAIMAQSLKPSSFFSPGKASWWCPQLVLLSTIKCIISSDY